MKKGSFITSHCARQSLCEGCRCSTPALAPGQLSGVKGPNPVKSIMMKTYTAVTSILFREPRRDDAQSGDSADGRLKRRGGVNLCSTSGQTLHGEFAEKELTRGKKTPFHANTQSRHNLCAVIQTHKMCVSVSQCECVCVCVGGE